eukprot:385035_1
MSTIEYIKWNILATVPKTDICLTVPYGINKDHYIALGGENETIKHIHEYNFVTNEWSTVDLTKHIPINVICCAGLDSKNNQLYILYNSSFVSKTISGHVWQTMIVKNSLFLIGNAFNEFVLKWKPEQLTFAKFGTNYNAEKMYGFGVIYVNKTNCLLVFGGDDTESNNNEFKTHILQFDMSAKTWNKLPVSLPHKMMFIGCTLAIRNQYVLIFGGAGYYKYYDEIYVYCIKNKTLKKSKQRCPRATVYVATTVNDTIKDQKIVFGFVRNEWNICNINNHYFPPNYILNLIHSFYLNEFVYLLDKAIPHKHYKMSTLDIV